MDFPGLPDRLALVRDTVARCQAARGWRHPVRIIGVTKTHGLDAVRAAVASGLGDVGENRVQEALQKQEAAAELKVDRHDLARELDRRASGAPQDVLVQVNCSDEPQKGGVLPAGLPALLDELHLLRGLRVQGLMTMSALTDDQTEQRRAFTLLRELRDTCERQ